MQFAVADLGGGLGVAYDPSTPPAEPRRLWRDGAVGSPAGGTSACVFEPGRLIVGNAGVLLSRVIRVKPGAGDPFVIVDAAMNDLMRPALYDAWHRIEAVRPSGAAANRQRRRAGVRDRRHVRDRAA